ncbi:MAG: hypothetical protein ACYTGV_18070, partial [Planctomycetota bacterium]
QRLERQNRWFKRIGATAVAALAVAVLIGQAVPKEPPELEVRSLKVKAADGTVRVSISPFEQGAAIGLSDREGKARMMLGVWGGPFIGFHDGKGETFTIGQKKEGSLIMQIHDQMTMKLAGRKADLLLEDPTGKVVWKASDE